MSETGEAAPVGRTAPKAVMGHVVGILPAGSPLLIDEVNSVHVTLLAEDMELGDADAAAIGQGRNLCLVGRELIQFSRAVQTGAASFRLEGLRRGLGGTEWAMADHVGDEPFLMIEEDRLVEPFAGRAAEIGSDLRLAAIGVGDSDPVEATVLVSGEAVTPLTPVHARAASDGAGGWTISWTRRSRNGWRWASGADVPLGEESERYEVRVLDGDTVVRWVETGAPSWIYDAAMVAADGGGAVTIEIRQVGSFAIGRPVSLALTI